MVTSSVIIRGVVVAVLTAFMPFTAFSYFRFRIHRKMARYQRVLEILELDEEAGRERALLPSESFHSRAFILPVLFVTVLSLLGFVHLLFGNEILSDGLELNLLLTGTVPLGELADGPRAERLGLLVLVIAFTSAFLWACQNIFRRLIAGDLHPGTYYSAGLRMCFAPLLALIVSWLPGVDEFGLAALPAVAFLTGLFPRRALHWVKERISIFSRRGTEADELSLDAIEGMTSFDRVRLSELAIDNAQGLAHARLSNLLAETPYGAPRLLDWIVQAKLYLLVKDGIAPLRKVSVRQALEFQDACADPDLRERLIALEGLDATTVDLACRACAQDPELARLRRHRDRLAAAGLLATESRS